MLTKAQAVEQLRQERKGSEHASTTDGGTERVEHRLHTEGHLQHQERDGTISPEDRLA